MSPRRRSGFTLVELMITIAIVSILAAIAVPNFVDMQYKAKRSEPFVNLDGIATAQLGYEAIHDTFLACPNNPGASLTKGQNEWDGTITEWVELGWNPDGKVRCNYKVSLFGSDLWFRADATCDLDNDNQIAYIRHYSSTGGATAYINDVYPDRY